MKKVLVISYYWPPSGGISVLRSLKIVKYLRNFGWEPIVYVPSNAHYPYLDEANESDIPDELTVIKGSIIEPFLFFKFLSGRKKSDPLNSIVQVRDKKFSLVDKVGIWLRGNLFIPDARSLWIKPSVRRLTKYLKENPVDAIFSDGPPHTNTYIAYQLSQNLNIPWLADFQDPWTQADYYEMMMISKFAHKIHQRQEQNCLRQAKKTTIASPTWKEDLEEIGASNVDVIYYGYDEDDFKDLKKRKNKNQLILSHVGLLGQDRSPAVFLNVLKELLEKDTSLKNKVVIKLAGQVDFGIQKMIKDLGLQDICHELGTISRKSALQLMMDSDLLLLPLNKAKNAKGRLPGKLYEYLKTENEILCLGPEESDAASILRNTECGTCIEYEDQQRMQIYLERLIYSDYLETRHPDTEGIQAFSNYNQTEQVAKYLNEIIEE